MPATYLTPGVYVEELPGGARTIEGVATSNALFIGYTRRGPVAEATRISSWGEYEDKFGGVAPGGSPRGINDFRESGFSQKVDYMGHAVLSYFQNGGKIAYVVRLVEGGGKATSGILQPQALGFEAVDEGSWADGLAVRITSDPVDPARFVITIGRLNDKGELIQFEEYPDVALTSSEGEERYIGDLLEEDSNLARLASETPEEVSLPDFVKRGRHRSKNVAGVSLDLTGASDDEVKLRVLLDSGSDTQTIISVDKANYSSLQALAVAIEERVRAAADGDAATGFTARVVADGDSRYIEIVSGETGDESRASVVAQDLGTTLNFEASDAMNGAEVAAASNMAVLHGGGDGQPAQPDAYTDAFEELELNPDINVILTPNAAWDGDGKPIVEAALTHCEDMKNRVLIIDPPRDTELTDPTVISGLGLPTSTYSQLYYPWINVANPIFHPDLRPTAPKSVLVPPSGFAAGIWSKIDARRGVWKAPAGVEAGLIGADGFEFEVGDPQQQVLNPAGVNVMRDKPGYGKVVWGSRTLSTRANPEWRYISVRRTAIMIEEAMRRGIQWAVFEPNSDLLWSSLRLSAEAYMDGLFRAGAFQGTKASDAYRVSCGLGSTMTQADIDRGYVILKIMFAPLKPAEFVVIQIQQLAGQS